ncbi:DMT family transporter [Faecalispora anaeroviscerum]|uniref:DMT family transporter n=1 Tax=Faecalispora anaeroviscerum TaxID=2991836 RepID=UPI0024BB78F0|nr:DMT family transporter [Faecalispora anaeroviscerum]
MHHLKQHQGELMLSLCAIIWGTSLIPQKLGTLYLGPFSFGAARFLMGAIIFFPLSLLLKRISREEKKTFLRKDLVIGGGLCGTAMFLGAYFQQLGLAHTTVGKTGFITSMYIVLIPLFGLFFHRKTELKTWICIALATVGLYLLCMSENFSISKGDFYVLISAVFWSIQITLVDTYSKKTDSLELVLVEFMISGLFSLFCALQLESPTTQAVTSSIGPILYTGIMVVGVAYTLQALGQKTVAPAIAGLILSMESLFAAVAGAVAFQETMSLREISGCVFMFCALILTQIKLPSFRIGRKADAEATPSEKSKKQAKGNFEPPPFQV